VVGTLANGSTANLEKSTKTTFQTDDERIAIVTPPALMPGAMATVAAKSPGTTVVTARYGSLAVEIPVTVLATWEEFKAAKRTAAMPTRGVLPFGGQSAVNAYRRNQSAETNPEQEIGQTEVASIEVSPSVMTLLPRDPDLQYLAPIPENIEAEVKDVHRVNQIEAYVMLVDGRRVEVSWSPRLMAVSRDELVAFVKRLPGNGAGVLAVTGNNVGKTEIVVEYGGYRSAITVQVLSDFIDGKWN